MTSQLKKLLSPWLTLSDKNDVKIQGLTIDSRTLKPGDLYFALVNNYIDEAIAKGASAILCAQTYTTHATIPIITLPDLQQKIGHIAAEYYNHPSKSLRVIGITGTNGKTSCTHFIAQCLKLAGLKTAVIGTLGNGLLENIVPGTHTTPNPIELQQLLAEFRQQHVEVVAMETSSHGLEQGRTNGTEFFLGAFTNLTHDHLDYHHTMENYAKAKFRLFEQPQLRYGILNLDDPQSLSWLKDLPKHLEVYGISTGPQPISSTIPVIYAAPPQIHNHGQITSITSPWGQGLLHTSLLGKFNISNLLIVLTALGIMGYPLATILEYLSTLKSIPGRMQTFSSENKPLVVVDYAHTPDALSKALQTLREYCKGQLWCVFGCGGDRDRSKRAEMGTIAETLADQIILTDDNPRHENPLAIVEDIRTGISNPSNIVVEHDRRRAIAHAIHCAKPHDVILIAGKGHETYQQVGNDKLPFSDALEVKLLLYT